MDTERKKPANVLWIVWIGLALLMVGLFVAAGIGGLVFFASKRQGDSMQQALRHFEELEKIKAPENIDEAGIRALVNDLLPGGKDEFAERKLRLLGQRSVPALIEVLKGPRFLQRPKQSDALFQRAPLEVVCRLLEPFGPSEAVAPLTVILRSGDEEVRKIAAQALGSIGTDECVEPMKAVLAGSSAEVRSGALKGIDQAIKSDRVSPKFQDAMFEAIVLLVDKPDKTFDNPPETLLKLNKEKACAVLLDDRVLNLSNSNLVACLGALNDARVIVPPDKLKGLMQPIAESLQGFPNESIYGLCLIALARSGDANGEKVIETALNGTNEFVSTMAAQALAVGKGVTGVPDKLFTKLSELGIEKLTKPEQTVVSIQLLEMEVNNGGFDQYFFNSGGDSARYALDGLKTMGAQKTAELLERGMAVFGPNGPPVDRDARMRQLDKLSEKRRKQFSNLDDAFFKNPDGLEKKMWLFLAAHSDTFKGGE